MDEFGKVGAEMSYLHSQIHSAYDSAESIADSDLEDGEPRKMQASPLCMQSREDCESSRMPIAAGKPLLQERGASAKRTQADLRKSLVVQVRPRSRVHRGTCCTVFIEKRRTRKPIQEFCFSKTLIRQIGEDLSLKGTKIICLVWQDLKL